jgi:hypothetical protein
VYLPRRDAQLNVERAFERARADALQRMFSEQRALEERQAAEKGGFTGSLSGVSERGEQ